MSASTTIACATFAPCWAAFPLIASLSDYGIAVAFIALSMSCTIAATLLVLHWGNSE